MRKKNLLIVLTLVNFVVAASQTDTITYTECEVDTTVEKYDKLLKYFMVEQEEIKHLWKFNAVDWGTRNPSVAFEQRLLNRSSLEFEVKLRTTSFVILDFLESGLLYYKANLSSEYRFYYNKTKREKKGKNTNGFSANYLFLGAGLGYFNTGYRSYDSDRNYQQFFSTVKSGIGFQRRIGSLFYTDIKLGIVKPFVIDNNLPNYWQSRSSMEQLQPYIDISFGIALK